MITSESEARRRRRAIIPDAEAASSPDVGSSMGLKHELEGEEREGGAQRGKEVRTGGGGEERGRTREREGMR